MIVLKQCQNYQQKVAIASKTKLLDSKMD